MSIGSASSFASGFSFHIFSDLSASQVIKRLDRPQATWNHHECICYGDFLLKYGDVNATFRRDQMLQHKSLPLHPTSLWVKICASIQSDVTIEILKYILYLAGRWYLISGSNIRSHNPKNWSIHCHLRTRALRLHWLPKHWSVCSDRTYSSGTWILESSTHNHLRHPRTMQGARRKSYFPSLHCHFLILSTAPEAKVISFSRREEDNCFLYNFKIPYEWIISYYREKELTFGWAIRLRTAFLWCVRVDIVFPAAKSHNYQAL